MSRPNWAVCESIIRYGLYRRREAMKQNIGQVDQVDAAWTDTFKETGVDASDEGQVFALLIGMELASSQVCKRLPQQSQVATAFVIDCLISTAAALCRYLPVDVAEAYSA